MFLLLQPLQQVRAVNHTSRSARLKVTDDDCDIDVPVTASFIIDSALLPSITHSRRRDDVRMDMSSYDARY